MVGKFFTIKFASTALTQIQALNRA